MNLKGKYLLGNHYLWELFVNYLTNDKIICRELIDNN